MGLKKLLLTTSFATGTAFFPSAALIAAEGLTPRYSYALSDPNQTNFEILGSSRLIEHKGKKALNLPDIRSRFILPRHTLNEPRGTLIAWILPIEDLGKAVQFPHHLMSNPGATKYTFFSDREALYDTDAANFCVAYTTKSDVAAIFIKFCSGSLSDARWSRRRGLVASYGDVSFQRMKWYCIAVTWDRPAKRARLYINGVLITMEDQFGIDKMISDIASPSVYGGNPSLGYGNVEFYDDVLPESTLQAIHRERTPIVDAAHDSKLQDLYDPKELAAFAWKPDASWEEKLSLSLQDPMHYNQFFLQGAGDSVSFEAEGMRIHTPDMENFHTRRKVFPDGRSIDMSRMYLWSRQYFEGDLYVSLEFKLLSREGLALLMTQASGMQGEDFLKDYFLRTNGTMDVVHREDVRNYDWEFYREVPDIRNDRPSHLLYKNPWFKLLATRVEPRNWELQKWYKLEYLQEGGRIRCVLDGKIIMDVTDDSFQNHGPVLHRGHIALRCMMNTDMIFRNLKVLTRSTN